jgi:dipeptidyl aminopeptidase/acylaminoacyl peptidase
VCYLTRKESDGAHNKSKGTECEERNGARKKHEGVMDWTTMLTALDTSIFNVLFKGTVGAENDNYDEYAKASIYNNISNLSGQKMILMHGEKDVTIGKRQSEGLATYMNSVNKPVELIIMPGEDHVYKKPASFVLLCEKALAFVGRAGKADCDII